MIRTEIDVTQSMTLKEFYYALSIIFTSYPEKDFESTVHFESGDLADEVHRLVVISAKRD